MVTAGYFELPSLVTLDDLSKLKPKTVSSGAIRVLPRILPKLQIFSIALVSLSLRHHQTTN
jgi:hypothetical protein